MHWYPTNGKLVVDIANIATLLTPHSFLHRPGHRDQDDGIRNFTGAPQAILHLDVQRPSLLLPSAKDEAKGEESHPKNTIEDNVQTHVYM